MWAESRLGDMEVLFEGPFFCCSPSRTPDSPGHIDCLHLQNLRWSDVTCPCSCQCQLRLLVCDVARWMIENMV